jgi:hypothetical protein
MWCHNPEDESVSSIMETSILQEGDMALNPGQFLPASQEKKENQCLTELSLSMCGATAQIRPRPPHC